MKRLLLFFVLIALSGLGCTTLESTNKFNSMQIGDNGAKPVAHVYGRITGWYFFGLFPFITGSVNDTGKCAVFTDTVTTENLVGLLTEKARGKGGNRVLDLQTHQGGVNLLLVSYCYVEGSCNTIR